MNGGGEDYDEDEVFDESEEEEEEEEEKGEGGGVREGRVDWEVTNTCDICKNIFTLNSYLNVHI